MPRPAKGPRLYLRTGRSDRRTGRPLPDVWVIRDGSVEIGTGCGRDRLHGPDGAEARLAEYLASKWAAPAGLGRGGPGDPADILIAELLAFYARDKAPTLADPAGTAVRVKTLMAWWGTKTLAEVRRSTCQQYVAWRTAQPLKQARKGAALDRRVTPAGARRELEDLSAAIHFWNGEHPLKVRPVVWLPPKPPSARDALTRDQAARLLKAALGWRYDPARDRWTRIGKQAIANRAHLRRFILIGLYTGTRPGLIPRLQWLESLTDPWADPDAGVIWRRGRAEREHATKRRPMVRLPDRLKAHLRRWRDLDLKRTRVDDAGVRIPAPASTVLHHFGRPIGGRIRSGFAGVVADAGLDPAITPHWMRHTCATWLMEREVPIWDAAAFTGMTTKTLESCYGHHRPSHQERARKAF